MYPPPWPSCKLFIFVHWLLSFQGTNPVQSWRECDLHLLEPSISAQCSPVHHFQNWFNIYKVTIIDENILYVTSCKIQQNNNFHPQIYCCSGPWYLGSIHLLQAHTWPSGMYFETNSITGISKFKYDPKLKSPFLVTSFIPPSQA